MKFLPLIWGGLWRKPARTLLTLLSVVVAFALFGLLQGVDSAFTKLIGQTKLDRMFVDSRYQQPVPYSYKARIEQVKGISKLTEVAFMPGYVQDQKNGAFAIFTIPSLWLAIRPEWEIPQTQVDAVGRTRAGVIVSEWLAKHNNWKIGDRFTLKSPQPQKDGNRDWAFDIVGIMHSDQANETRFFLANYPYLDESRQGGTGTVSRFLMRIEQPDRSAQIARQIDAMFANSAVATRTQSEQDQAQTALAQIGDFKFFTRAIISAVFFALLFLTLNTTMESVRERTAELATLKTLGFTDTRVLILVLAESITLFVVAALVGLGISAALFPFGGQFLGGMKALPPAVYGIGAVLAIVAALVSALLPALRAKRLNIVEALAVR